MKRILVFALLGFGHFAFAAEGISITATHALAEARPGEVLAVPFGEVQRRLPGAQIFHLQMTNVRTGASVPLQVTNYEHDDRGFAADELVWQHDFAAGEASATFRLERTEQIVAPVAPRVFARFVPERYDDFAWENDRIAHRTYGAALDSAAAGRERLRSSGIDIWVKRVRYPIVDRWYLKGHDGFHKDDGEGLDPYHIGISRGAGGTGIWDGERLRTSGNFTHWKVLANGPLRAVFELSYAPWDAGDGVQVTETKRFVVEAGRNFDAVESTFTFSGPAELTVGVGITRPPGAGGTQRKFEREGAMSFWQEMKQGGLGIGVLLAPGRAVGFAEEPLGRAGANGNMLVLARVKSGEPLRYHLGAGWDRSGDFADRAAWEGYVEAFARRRASPVKIEFGEK